MKKKLSIAALIAAIIGVLVIIVKSVKASYHDAVLDDDDDYVDDYDFDDYDDVDVMTNDEGEADITDIDN